MIRLAIRAAAADAEVVLAELLELAPSGVEEVETPDGGVEYAVYGWPGELPDIPDVRAAAGGARIEVSSSEIADDWDERWKRFHRPALIDSPAPDVVPAVYLRPPWEPDRPVAAGKPAQGDPIEVVIDPGQAFGTGGHATTRLCLKLMLALAASDPARERRGRLLDIGTGSGVLAIAAAKLGYEPVIALDNDPNSVESAAQNASVNGVSLEVRRLDVRAQTIPWPKQARAEPVTIVANLLRPLLLDLAARLPAAPAHLLASGLLVDEVDEILDVYEEQWGMTERKRRRDGDWAAIWLQGESGNSVAARTIER